MRGSGSNREGISDEKTETKIRSSRYIYQGVAVTSYHRSRILIIRLGLFVIFCFGFSGFIHLFTFDGTRLLHFTITH